MKLFVWVGKFNEEFWPEFIYAIAETRSQAIEILRKKGIEEGICVSDTWFIEALKRVEPKVLPIDVPYGDFLVG